LVIFEEKPINNHINEKVSTIISMKELSVDVVSVHRSIKMIKLRSSPGLSLYLKQGLGFTVKLEILDA